MPEDLGQTLRLRTERFFVLSHSIPVAHQWTGKADRLPADHSGIAAMKRIAQKALDRMRSEQLKEVAFFHGGERFILFASAQAGEVIRQRLQTRTINLARARTSLV